MDSLELGESGLHVRQLHLIKKGVLMLAHSLFVGVPCS